MFWLRQLDLDLFRAIHIGWHRSILDVFFLVVTYTGLGWIQVPATMLIGVIPKTRRYALPLFWAWLFSGLVNTAIKHSIERERPSLLSFALPQEPHKYNSFPSGHTVTSFAIAFLILIWTWKTPHRWAGCLAVVWATLVGISRIYRGVHWPTDVLGAVALGLTTACVVALVQEACANWGRTRRGYDTAPSVD